MKKLLLIVAALGLCCVATRALGDAVITDVQVTPATVIAGNTIDVDIDITVSDTGTDGDSLDDLLWAGISIELVSEQFSTGIFCSDVLFSASNPVQETRGFQSIPVPIDLPVGDYDVVVRTYDGRDDPVAEGEFLQPIFEFCGTSPDPDDDGLPDDAVGLGLATLTVTPNNVETDLLLCIDSSTSISIGDYQGQIEGLTSAIDGVLRGRADGTVRLTAMQFSNRGSVGVGPIIISDTQALDDFLIDLTTLRQSRGLTNIRSCIEVARQASCGRETCPDDDIVRILDISTDGAPNLCSDLTVEEIEEDDASEVAACTQGEAAQAVADGFDEINAILVNNSENARERQENIDALTPLLFPTPATVFGADLDQCGGSTPPDDCLVPPDAGGFLQVVAGFDQYAAAITAKITAETMFEEFRVRKQYIDDNTLPVSVTLSCSEPASVVNNPQPASPGTPAVFRIQGADTDTLCTATEAVPEGYMADISDCQDGDPVGGECTLLNMPGGPPGEGGGTVGIPVMPPIALLLLALSGMIMGVVVLRRD